jgi:hypothetical protein
MEPGRTASPRSLPPETILLLALTGAGLVLRLALWHTQPYVSVDGTTYIRLARWLVGGPDFSSNQSLGYPVLIAAFKVLAGDWVRAARWVDLAAGTVLIPLTWLLARAVVRNRWMQLAPAVLVAFLPLPVRYSLTTMSEAPYAVLLVGMFLLALRDRPFRGGILGGLAYAVRPEALTSVAVLGILRMRRPRSAILLVGGAALVVTAYVVGQGIATGSWTLTAKTSNLAAAEWWQNEPVAGEENASLPLRERVEQYGKGSAASYPGRFGAMGDQLLRHGGYLLPLLAVAGLFGPGLPLAAALVQFFITPFFALGAHARFILPYLPFLWVLAASGLERLRPAALRWGLGLLCVAGLVLTVVRERPGYTFHEDGYFPELVEAGEWLQAIAGPETIVYDRKPLTAFYAGASYRAIPLGDYEETLDAIVAEGGDYLVVDEAVVNFFRPALLPLVTDKAVAWAEPRLRPVYVNPKYEDRMTIIFRVVRPGGPPPLPFEYDLREHRKLLIPLVHQNDHFWHGLLYMRSGRPDLAAGEFGFAVKVDSTDAAAMNNLAWCLVQTGDHLASAEKNARKAVELEPGNPDYLDTLVNTLRAVGKVEEAERLAARLDSLEAAQEGEGP